MGERGARGFPAVLPGEPAGGLVAQEHTEQEEDGGEALHGQRDEVHGRAADVQQGAVVDPERQHDAQGDEELVQPGQTATDRTRCVLRHVEGVDHRGETDTEAGNESAKDEAFSECSSGVLRRARGHSPSNVQCFQVATGGNLHDHTEDHQNRRRYQTGLSSPAISHLRSDEGSKETARLQQGHNVGREICLRDRTQTVQSVFSADG